MRRKQCRNRNSQRRALAHAWPSKGPHRIIPYQHSKNRLNIPKIIFVLDNLCSTTLPWRCTLLILAVQSCSRVGRLVHSFVLVKLNHFFVDSNASKAYLHPLIYFRIFDPTGLFFMNVIFVIFGLYKLLPRGQAIATGRLGRLNLSFVAPLLKDGRRKPDPFIQQIILRFRFSYLTGYPAVKLTRVAPLLRCS